MTPYFFPGNTAYQYLYRISEKDVEKRENN